MHIKDLFSKDINRSINGVIKVSQDDEASIEQELSEYVVTRELQKHFAYFLDNYESALDIPTDKIGVWISGFFGSGKSHFLKMLSYLLENKQVAGKRAIDYFEGKIEDEMVFAKMRRCAAVPTEAILFNVDTKGSQWKEGTTAQTALLRAFERVFFEHLGFCGEDLKLAKLEMHIDSLGKTQQFRDAFLQVNGEPWVEARESYTYFEDDVVEVLQSVLGMSEAAARNWYNGTEDDAIAVDSFVDMVNEYVTSKAKAAGGDFRLLFMVDEVGQFIGDDSSLMLNLQTLVEVLGSRCAGRVWVMVTSQESIDGNQLIVGDDFSKIQGRFATRLSLSSSSVDEVIKRRVLDKTSTAQLILKEEYADQSAVLRNLFTFEDSRGDLHGYESENDFVESYPFVSYQFKVLPDVMTEIRKHGIKAKHMSTGERSMLSAFQESAQAVEGESTATLVPFWRFFDTISKDLEHGILQVVSRATAAAEVRTGLQPEDVEVLKLLYLIRYITYLKSTLNNIAILMIDGMNVDKVALRERLKASLDRLIRENYVAQQGDTYNFLTDTEQDIARAISEVRLDPSDVLDGIKKALFSDIFTATKLKHGANDFPFDCYVDDSMHGVSRGGMKLNVITLANNDQLCQADDGELELKSSGQAMVVLSDEADYFDLMSSIAKVRKYAQTNNVSQMDADTQRIVRERQNQANYEEKVLKKLLEDAVVHARFAVDGHMVSIRAANAKQAFEMALDKLVDATFTKADYITSSATSDTDILHILRGQTQDAIDGFGGGNEKAVKEVKTYLELQHRMHIQTTMDDVQRKYQAKPYGWREIDVAAVVAQLVAAQDAAILYGGQAMNANDKEIVNHLRKHTDKVEVKLREKMAPELLSAARSLLREMLGSTVIPEDEDGLVAKVASVLTEQQEHCRELISNHFTGLPSMHPYPGKNIIEQGAHIATEILDQKADAYSFLRAFTKNKDELLYFVEDMQDVDNFFSSPQLQFFKEAVAALELAEKESLCISGDETIQNDLAEIRDILNMENPYSNIARLSVLTQSFTQEHSRIVGDKRNEFLGKIEAASNELKAEAEKQGEYKTEALKALSSLDAQLTHIRESAHKCQAASDIDALSMQLKGLMERGYDAIDAAVDAAREEAAKAAERVPSTFAANTAAGAAGVAGGSSSASSPVTTYCVSTVGGAATGEAGGAATGEASGATASATTGATAANATATVPVQPQRKKLRRDDVFEAARLSTPEEVDAYLAAAREKLLAALEEADFIRLS